MKQPDALQLSQDPDLSDEKVKRRAWFVEVIVGLHEKLAALDDGRPADYIPQLAEVEPDQFAISAFTTDGAAVGVGDTEQTFTIQQRPAAPGDLVVMEAGFSGSWKTLSPVKKIYFTTRP